MKESIPEPIAPDDPPGGIIVETGYGNEEIVISIGLGAILFIALIIIFT